MLEIYYTHQGYGILLHVIVHFAIGFLGLKSTRLLEL